MKILSTTFAMRTKLITEPVERAQAEGELRSDWDARRITRRLLAGEAGTLVQLKGMLSQNRARAMIDDMLASLG